MPTFPFHPDAAGDPPCNAYCMATAAAAAYLAGPALPPLVTGWGLGDLHTFQTSSIQGYIASGSGFGVLAFRGSDFFEIEDWVSNTDFDLVPVPAPQVGQIHSGFQRAAEAIWPQVEELTRKHHRAGNKLFLTGHSLGGSLAMLTAERLWASPEPLRVDGIYTFGQPRTGDRAFAERYDRELKERTYRYVNHYDLIPRLPPRFLGYQHTGQLRFIDENGVLHDNPSLWQQLMLTLDPKGKTNAQQFIDELTAKFPGALRDHQHSAYVSRLLDLCPRARQIEG